MSIFYDLDLSNINDESSLEGRRVPACRAHVEVLEVTENNEGRTPAIVFKLGVLAGTVPEAVGGTFREKLYLSDKTKTRAAIFARRFGLISPQNFGQKKASIDWTNAIGRQAIAEIVEEQYERSDGTKGTVSKLSFAGLWSLDDERVKSVPRDPDAIQRMATGKPAPGRSAKPAQDDFSDI